MLTISGWDVGTFFSYYTMVFLCPVLYVGWKVYWKTSIIKPEEADLVCTFLCDLAMVSMLIYCRFGNARSLMPMKRVL